MRDLSTGRNAYDRVLMAVAASFLVLSAGSAVAQSDGPRVSPAELAIDAAVPMPEPANVPPPTIHDFKIDDAKPDTTASVPAGDSIRGSLEVAPSAVAPDVKKDSTVAIAPPTAPSGATLAVTTPAATTPAATTPSGGTAPATLPAATTAAPTVESVKPPAVAAADQPVADRLREALSSKGGRYFDRKGERAAVDKFYAARDYAPLWTQAGIVTRRAKGVMSRLSMAGADGLNAADYPAPDFATAASPEALADADLKLTASMLDYARQAQSGRMHWSQVSGDILYPEHPTDPAEVLATVMGANDAAAALDGYNPPHKGYRDLKAKLAELRGETALVQQPLADGPALKFTKSKKNQTVMEDPRVTLLRARLGVAQNADDTRYDAAVADAVRKFQAANDLTPSGVFDQTTLRAMNAPKRDRQIDTVIVNMERWRWLPRQLGAASLGNAYVMLNVPDFTLKVMHNNAQAWTTRVVVGKVGKHATPLLTETMKYITVNPTWNVPPSIIYNEYLPALQQDPTVLQRMGLKMERARDGSIRISQPPGEANALGRIRFNFPNKFLVYQHDTPDKHLFAKDERAFSHGCMRVQNPDQYAATLLGIVMPNERYTAEKIRSMYGRSEIDLKFATPVPVHITYQTAFVDDAGKLQTRKDIYGRDAQMLAVLRNGKGKDLENVVAHSQPNYTRPRADVPQGVAFNDSGPSFFERLFGGNPPPQPQDRRRRLYQR